MERSRPTVPSAARAALGTFVDALHARFGDAVGDVRLFGSFARREANEDSDVDVAVVLERVDWRTKREVIDLATDVGLSTGLVLSPVVFDREIYERWREQGRPLVKSIERDGVPV
jgi:hypothetical protein